MARHGKILYTKAAGLADMKRHLPVTVDTQFRIGSITKQFTAAAILRLQEAGKLQLTDTVAKYYPDFPRGDEVTLRHLLTHTSGIHSYTAAPSFLANVTRPTATADVIAAIKKYPYDFSPGERWSYSNSGYYLLGDIVAQVSGQSYEDYLKATFFEPLGMTATGIFHNDRPPAAAALGYSYTNGHFEPALDWDMTWAAGAGAIYSTIRDLHLWNEAVFNGKVLNPANLAAAFTPVITEENKNDHTGNGYGYGWLIGQLRGTREISHGGGLQGFVSYLLRMPEQECTVVVLENQLPAKFLTDSQTLAREIATIYLGSELAPAASAAATLEPKPVPGAALAAIVGRYDFRFCYAEITREGDRVFAQLAGQGRNEIFPKSETEFFFKVVDAQLVFDKDEKGGVTRVNLHQNGQILHAPRLEPVHEIQLTDAQIEALRGDYEFKPVGKLTLSRDAGRLYEQATGLPLLELSATSETELFVRLVNARLTVVKGPEGKVQKLILHENGTDQELPRMK